ncbi:MAG TPA: hypothetical protein VM656_08320 [Pyrinomonadaceae bacterium]|nr:hypothetical protein [Pyrinomonadaceae bacterium]
MRLPFGLDLKSLVVGAVFVWFVLPWIMGMVNRSRNGTATPAV